MQMVISMIPPTIREKIKPIVIKHEKGFEIIQIHGVVNPRQINYSNDVIIY
jgi:hypothetical protein